MSHGEGLLPAETRANGTVQWQAKASTSPIYRGIGVGIGEESSVSEDLYRQSIWVNALAHLVTILQINNHFSSVKPPLQKWALPGGAYLVRLAVLRFPEMITKSNIFCFSQNLRREAPPDFLIYRYYRKPAGSKITLKFRIYQLHNS